MGSNIHSGFSNRIGADNYKTLVEIASLAFGSGRNEGTNGGEGNIGMLGNHVIKFNVNYFERSSGNAKDQNQLRAANLLRDKLFNVLRDFCKGNENLFKEICKKLDINVIGSANHSKSLLSRKVVAEVINDLEKNIDMRDSAGNKLESVWTGLNSADVKSRGKMDLSSVRANVIDDLGEYEAKKILFESWIIKFCSDHKIDLPRNFDPVLTAKCIVDGINNNRTKTNLAECSTEEDLNKKMDKLLKMVVKDEMTVEKHLMDELKRYTPSSSLFARWIYWPDRG